MLPVVTTKPCTGPINGTSRTTLANNAVATSVTLAQLTVRSIALGFTALVAAITVANSLLASWNSATVIVAVAATVATNLGYLSSVALTALVAETTASNPKKN
jgi:hypothetical protein